MHSKHDNIVDANWEQTYLDADQVDHSAVDELVGCCWDLLFQTLSSGPPVASSAAPAAGILKNPTRIHRETCRCRLSGRGAGCVHRNRTPSCHCGTVVVQTLHCQRGLVYQRTVRQGPGARLCAVPLFKKLRVLLEGGQKQVPTSPYPDAFSSLLAV